MATIILEPCFEQGSPYIMARVLGEDGEPAVPAQISQVFLEVWEEHGLITVHDAQLDPSDVFFASLQVEPRWTRDGIGYNFGFQVLPAMLPAGRKRYCFEFKCITTSGLQFWVKFVQPTLALQSV